MGATLTGLAAGAELVERGWASCQRMTSRSAGVAAELADAAAAAELAAGWPAAVATADQNSAADSRTAGQGSACLVVDMDYSRGYNYPCWRRGEGGVKGRGG